MKGPWNVNKCSQIHNLTPHKKKEGGFPYEDQMFSKYLHLGRHGTSKAKRMASERCWIFRLSKPAEDSTGWTGWPHQRRNRRWQGFRVFGFLSNINMWTKKIDMFHENAQCSQLEKWSKRCFCILVVDDHEIDSDRATNDNQDRSLEVDLLWKCNSRRCPARFRAGRAGHAR